MQNAKKNFKEGFEMLKKAVAQKHIKAISELAYMYYDGVDGFVDKDIPAAKSLYEEAAAADNSVAILILGIMYDKGVGVKKDISKANGYFVRVMNLDDNPDAVTRANQELKINNEFR